MESNNRKIKVKIRWINIILVFLIIILTIVLRYPAVPDESSVDTFIVHQYAKYVIEEKYVFWIFHPLSMTGYFIYGYPVSTPLLYSTLSLLTGLTINKIILILSIFFSLIITLTTYMLNKIIFKGNKSIIGILFLVTSTYFILLTQYQLPTRVPALFFIIICTYFVIREHFTKSKKNWIVITIVIILLLITHRGILFILPFIILPNIFSKVAQYITKHIPNIKNFFNILIILTLIVVIILPLFNISILKEFGLTRENWISHRYDNIKYIGTLMTYLYDIILYTNILIIFGLVAIFLLALKKEKKYIEYFLLFSIIFSAPIFFDREYFLFFYLPFFSVLVTYGITEITYFSKKIELEKKLKNFITIIIISSLFISIYIIYLNNRPIPNEYGYYDYITERTYSAANFINYNIPNDKKILFNEYYLRSRLKAYINISSVLYIDIIKNEEYKKELEFLRTDKKEMIKNGFYTSKPIILKNKKEELGNYEFYEYWSFLGDENTKNKLWRFFDIEYLIENKYLSNRYEINLRKKYTIGEDSNKIYDNNQISIYKIR